MHVAYIFFPIDVPEHKETNEEAHPQTNPPPKPKGSEVNTSSHEEAHPQGENRYIRPCSFLFFGSEDVRWTS